MRSDTLGAMFTKNQLIKLLFVLFISFGDDRMLVEKFVDQPRHIEIQVNILIRNKSYSLKKYSSLGLG
jgi:biotin carboxylase